MIMRRRSHSCRFLIAGVGNLGNGIGAWLVREFLHLDAAREPAILTERALVERSHDVARVSRRATYGAPI